MEGSEKGAAKRAGEVLKRAMRGALGGGGAKTEFTLEGIEVEAPTAKEAKELLHYSAERAKGLLDCDAERQVKFSQIKGVPSKEKGFIDHGAETQLKVLSRKTKGILSRAKAEELEDPHVRGKIKDEKYYDTLVGAPEIKKLPKENVQRFKIFVLTSLGDNKFHQEAFNEAEQAYRYAYHLAQDLDDETLQAICLNLIGAAIGMRKEHDAK